MKKSIYSSHGFKKWEDSRPQNTEESSCIRCWMKQTNERQCGNCGATVKDITSHGLQECPKVTHQRDIFKITMRLYNAPKKLDMKCKIQVMKEALVKKSLMKVLCNFLVIIWNWDD